MNADYHPNIDGPAEPIGLAMPEEPPCADLDDVKDFARAAATKGADAALRALHADLEERADWLRSEYMKGGSFEHLSARESECRYIALMADKLRNRLTE